MQSAATTSTGCARASVGKHETLHRRAARCPPGLKNPTHIADSAGCLAGESGEMLTSSSSRYGALNSTMERPVVPVVNVPVSKRPPPSVPQPVPVVHSTTYMQQISCPVNAKDMEPNTSVPPEQAAVEEPFHGSALEWALRRVDKSLDELEDNPLPMQQQIYDISRGPVGQATGKGLQAAAGLTFKAGVEAVKIVAPVGKWALAEGVKAAAGLVQYAFLEAAKAKEAKEKESKSPSKGSKGRQWK